MIKIHSAILSVSTDVSRTNLSLYLLMFKVRLGATFKLSVFSIEVCGKPVDLGIPNEGIEEGRGLNFVYSAG